MPTASVSAGPDHLPRSAGGVVYSSCSFLPSMQFIAFPGGSWQHDANARAGSQRAIHIDRSTDVGDVVLTFVRSDSHPGGLGRIEWLEQSVVDEVRAHPLAGIEHLDNGSILLAKSAYADLSAILSCVDCV